jgi:hypothetical protein
MGLFAAGFVVLGIVSSAAALSRRVQEIDAPTVALLYGVGFAILAVSELVNLAEAAWGWSLASAFGVAGTGATVLAAVVTGGAVLLILVAALIELREERVYRASQRRRGVHGVV